MRDRLGGIEPATEMSERREIQAELDAAAFHVYGLNREQTAFILEDFHRIQNPRLMDEDYFDMVLAKYDDLAYSVREVERGGKASPCINQCRLNEARVCRVWLDVAHVNRIG